MTEAILRMDGIELRTTDRLTCRTLYRMIGTAMSDRDVAELIEPAGATRPDHGKAQVR
jgi:hypothetical protein